MTVSDFFAGVIHGLLRVSKMFQRAIAKQLNLSKNTVALVVKRYDESGNKTSTPTRNLKAAAQRRIAKRRNLVKNYAKRNMSCPRSFYCQARDCSSYRRSYSGRQNESNSCQQPHDSTRPQGVRNEMRRSHEVLVSQACTRRRTTQECSHLLDQVTQPHREAVGSPRQNHGRHGPCADR